MTAELPIDRMTVLEAVVAWLDRALQYNRSVMVPPAAILWTDEDREWSPVVPLVRKQRPQLLTLGEYDEETLTGPAIWVRCMLARTLDAAGWAERTIPILYLPGVSRQMLRAVESCPPDLQPLAELQYRGVFWSQENARDWSLLAFLKSKSGLALDVAQDARTLEAMQRAVIPLAHTRIGALQGHRLEAADFDQLLTPDPARDLLSWMNDPATMRSQWGAERWAAFRARCVEAYSFDPDTEGELVGAEHLGQRLGVWTEVWQRFADGPRGWPHLEELLTRVERPAHDMFEDRSAWPGANTKLETALREQMQSLEDRKPADATKMLLESEKRHGMRRTWVWAKLDRSPLAFALEHLATLARVAGKPAGGSTPEAMAETYAAEGWQADAAVLRALDCVRRGEDVAAVRSAVRAVYLPWLEASAERLQELVSTQAFPGASSASRTPPQVGPGECLLFADGLRLDAGKRLVEALRARGLSVAEQTRWIGLPSVTATSKPAQSPIARRLAGRAEDAEFLPSLANGEPLTTYRFRKLLQEEGIQCLETDSVGAPDGRAWTEHGQLDHMGHEQGWKLAWRIEEQVQELKERVEELLEAGWQKVRIVTDHGWLLMPGGLPKVNLPGHLAETRWGRCAVLKASSQSEALVVPWRWSPDVSIALARGVSCFVKGMEYAHGGLSLQECLTPLLEVSRAASAAPAQIEEVQWRGLRCRVLVKDAPAGALVDLRFKPADAGSTLCQGGRALDGNGRAALLVEDDQHLGTAVSVVVIASNGSVIAKTPTCIGD